MASLTIAYLTFRLRPHFDWFARSLARELRATPEAGNVQVVVIDGRLWYDEGHRRLALLDAAAGRIKFEHHPPKPTIWQGPTRLSKSEFFCAANARNTAFCYATGDHVCFVDDLSVLLPGWLKEHLYAAQQQYVLAGTTCKNKHIIVDDQGDVTGYELFAPGQDSRIGRIPVQGHHRCGGDWLYGGTFSVPLSRALQVGGQDENCDCIGGEDYDFGMRLQRTGCAVYISKACGTFEDEDGHHAEAPMVRLDKPWPPPGPGGKPINPGWDGPYTSNYLLHRLQREDTRIAPLGNAFNLAELRTSVLAGNSFSIPTGPTTHWVDGQPLAEM